MNSYKASKQSKQAIENVYFVNVSTDDVFRAGWLDYAEIDDVDVIHKNSAGRNSITSTGRARRVTPDAGFIIHPLGET